jgi:pyridoxal phosphate enzyme (YggS family)
MNESVVERLNAVEQRVRAACLRAGRDPSRVSILAVAKTFGPEAVREAAAAGVTAIGENRVREAAEKIPLCPGHLDWHMIGHLQTNKVRPAVSIFGVIHSVDSRRLLEAVDRACAAQGKTMPVYLEVNVSGESSKFGFEPDEVPAVLEHGAGLAHVDLQGLMTMPPFSADPEDARPFFRRLRGLRDEWQAGLEIPLPQLSMGMSNDFEVAVEEGATWLRLGSVLFGPRRGRPPAKHGPGNGTEAP